MIGTSAAAEWRSLEEAQIRELMANEASAICAKDADRIMAHYTEDVIFFDCKFM